MTVVSSAVPCYRMSSSLNRALAKNTYGGQAVTIFFVSIRILNVSWKNAEPIFSLFLSCHFKVLYR